MQRFGTGSVATVFGPITLGLVLAIGLSGLYHILDEPGILVALNPIYIVYFLVNSPEVAFVTVGAIFLAVTGAEALYADLGHFGRRPIVLAWLSIVFPCLLLNYFGQGAFVLANGGIVGHPFFEMNEGWTLLPMVVLATAATVIASQAVISGCIFADASGGAAQHAAALRRSSTRRKTQSGQIYMPRVNLLLALVRDAAVRRLRRSSELASAYGISVTGNMLMTTILLFVVMRRIWKWPLRGRRRSAWLFVFIDVGFFVSNIVKVIDGGWASLAVAIVGGAGHVRPGCAAAAISSKRPARTRCRSISWPRTCARSRRILVPGTAVFLTSDPHSAPTALMHSLKHYKVLHEQNVILSVVTAPAARRVRRANASRWRRSTTCSCA